VAFNEVASICSWSYDRAPGRSGTGAYSKLDLHKNKGFFCSPGVTQENPRALPMVTALALSARPWQPQ